MKLPLFVAVALFPIGMTAAPDAHGETFKHHQDRVLGTSFELTVKADSEQSAEAAKAAALAEIARLESILSTYYADSEISRLNAASELKVAPELIEVLSRCEALRESSGNALSCRIGALLAEWDAAEKLGSPPDSVELRLLAGEIRRADVSITPATGLIRRSDPVSFNVNALAKGYIIDAALEKARLASPEADAILINIGGDIAAWNRDTQGVMWQVAIEQTPQKISLGTGAIATSGMGPRNIKIGEAEYSHIISPADGWPVDHIRSVSVYAPSAMEADATATLLSVLSLNDGLAWVEQTVGIEALITASDGRSHPSSGWNTLQTPEGPAPQEALSNVSMSVTFEIPEKDVSDYERPYIAAWVSDDKRNLVRILLLAGDEARWMEENYYWFRRFGRKAGSLVDAESGPTRRPGHYDLSWDGKDHDGNGVPAGDYVFHIEASREHGGHQHESVEFQTGKAGISSFTIEPGDELGPVTISVEQR